MPYSPTAAARLVGVSASAIRLYCKSPALAPFLSAGATPGAKQARQLTDADLRVLAYVRQQTAAGITLATVADRLQAGELDSFTWPATGPEPEPQEPAQSTALALATVLQAQLATITQERTDLLERLIASERKVATLETQLQALQAQQPASSPASPPAQPGPLRRLWERLTR